MLRYNLCCQQDLTLPGQFKLYISKNPSKQDIYPSTLAIYNALRYNLCGLQDLTLPGHFKLYISKNPSKQDIYPSTLAIYKKMLSVIICVAGRM